MMNLWIGYQWVFWLVLVGGGAWLATNGRSKVENGMQAVVDRALMRAATSQTQQPGFVRIRFPVYAGAFVVVKEVTPDVWVPRSNARDLVNQLAAISLKFGLLTLFAPYVLLMLGINYWTHLRALAAR
jgi:hypothetical protein